MRRLVGLALALLTACAASPPPHWEQGGAPLALGPARWNRPDSDSIEILPDGTVLEDGSPLLVVDRAGRIVDDDHEPVAIVLPDGQIAGTDRRYLGRIGVTNASPPWSGTAWLSILPNGQVVAYTPEGERESLGVWSGCAGPLLRTCTLVTHLVLVRRYQRAPRSGVGIGIGF
jgi:hypothetical protein